MELWSLWWVWACAALALAIFELLSPGYIFLGIAIGAALTAIIVALPIALSLPVLLVIFAALSLLGWLALRRFFKAEDDQTRIVHEDINK